MRPRSGRHSLAMSLLKWWQSADGATSGQIARIVLILALVRALTRYCGLDNMTTIDDSGTLFAWPLMTFFGLTGAIFAARGWVAGRRVPASLPAEAKYGSVNRLWIAGVAWIGTVAVATAWVAGGLLDVAAQHLGGPVEFVEATVISSRATSTPRSPCKRYLTFREDAAQSSMSFCLAAPFHTVPVTAALIPGEPVRIAIRATKLGHVAVSVYAGSR